MISFANLDPTTTFMDQLQSDDTAPVTLVNTFLVPEGEMDAVLAAWEIDAAIMKSSPGFIWAQLYRGTGESRVLTNVAVWESVSALRAAFFSDEFQATIPRYPDGTVAQPHLLHRVAVPGICTA